MRRRCALKGFELALCRKQRPAPPVPKLLNGEQQAYVIALRPSFPPAGYGNWSLRLLARHVVKLEIVASISHCTWPLRTTTPPCSKRCWRLGQTRTRRPYDLIPAPATIATGETPPHWAGHSTSPAVVEGLLAAEANIEVRDEDRETPLYRAAQFGSNPAVIEVLLAVGANANARNTFGETPLDIAQQHHAPRKKAIELLRGGGGKAPGKP